ncbi:DUF4160 domain-containing protein [Xanthobacter aminoxidans]|uniref:DUF4160 domain-containing protein n=1 Tax=Xanthobacter aminoxidans TaxID=186280 RepID=UPI002022FEBA|nr:DUF4160 domain-containing protein [Xanthobacter aminoxidans]MCL8385867.1 DUF4160 domain-containing protein [Xanthobacter aminoxidans]
MPRIVALGNWVIYIYPDDHAPPHFHVRGAGLDAQIEIESLQVLRGCIPRNDLPGILAWAAENKALLIEKWKAFNERG